MLCALLLKAACPEIRFSIGKHHLTWRAITLTCGVRQLLSVGCCLGILLSSPRKKLCNADTFMCNETSTWMFSELLSLHSAGEDAHSVGRLLNFNTTLIMHETINTAPCWTSEYFSPNTRSCLTKLFCLNMATSRCHLSGCNDIMHLLRGGVLLVQLRSL